MAMIIENRTIVIVGVFGTSSDVSTAAAVVAVTVAVAGVFST
jgi:hypothetical protein